jgi:hypothetical protein
MKYAPGTYKNLFAANSLWNSKPKNPGYGAPGQVIYDRDWMYHPTIEAGAFSTVANLAKASDPSETVLPLVGNTGITVGDTLAQVPSIKIQNWPADLVIASGADGHCDIVDPTSKRIHSFWMLRKDGAVHRAELYNWAPLGGSGFGDPAHFIQGARASAVLPSAGLIRKHEVNDGDDVYRHALAMSLPLQSLAAVPSYIRPTTNKDWDAYNNTGTIPYGTRLMLRSDYQPLPSTLNNPGLMRIIKTLIIYGAFVVDRNVGTPYAIYMEIGAPLQLSVANPPVAWDTAVYDELDRIADNLVPMTSCDGYIGGDGVVFTDTSPDANLISLRGVWTGGAVFDSWSQSVILPAVKVPTEFTNFSQLAFRNVDWAGPDFVNGYRLTVTAEGDATLKTEVADGNGNVIWTPTPSTDLSNGRSCTLQFPQFTAPKFTAKRGPGTRQLRVRLDMRGDRRQAERRSDVDRRIAS